MEIQIQLQHKSYPIYLGNHTIDKLQAYVSDEKKYFILTDTNIPESLVRQVQSYCKQSTIYKVEPGENSKSFATYKAVCEACLAYGMQRSDVLIALGGGVIGDLGGFVASSYMRGISFMSIPTTTLSQIDSSIGGKVAINLDHVKNIIGAFYHPDAVFIDFTTLATLPKRHIQSGLVEALKAGLIHDASLYEIFKQPDYMDQLETIVFKALLVKKAVVEQDEKESGLRKTLNFGHTIGHGIEAYYDLKTYYHGECVGLGMLYFLEDQKLQEQVKTILQHMQIPVDVPFEISKVMQIIAKDKKAKQTHIDVVRVDQPGHAYIQPLELSEIQALIERSHHEK
ncbi:3-dehydroquinate synthase [Erysipelotrichaceae bacterium MTC7]|nr:3-dehydroquinate synthase [Erysipelotrichaceae bacterium MTC7]